MKVISLNLKNILGLREFSVDCKGGLTVISGRNGSGKTSALEGIRTLIGGGNLATLRNLDAPDGEASEGVLVLDGEEGRLIISKKNEKLTVKKQVGDSAAFENVPAPQRFLDALFDAPAANPVQFLTCKDKDRITLLLEAMVLTHNSSDMWAAIGLDPRDFPAYPKTSNPLQEIGYVKDVIFNERTGVNRDEKAKRSTCEQLLRQIPAEQPTEISVDEKQAELDALREEIASNRNAAQAETRRLKDEAAAIVSSREKTLASELAAYEVELNTDFLNEKMAIGEKIDQIEKETERKIALLRATLTARKDANRSRLNERQDGYARTMSETRAEVLLKTKAIDDQYESALSELKTMSDAAEILAAEIATLREQQKDAVRIQTLRDQARKQESEADDLKSLSDKMTAALKALEAYKAQLTSALPIAGLDLAGGEVRVNGVPWEQLNTAQKIRIAVQVSCLRFGDEKFRPIFVDGAEALDSDTLSAMEAELSAAGAQAFIARVADTDLTVGSK